MPVEPNEFDNERLIKIREDQTDPIIQYYIVRSDLGMSMGKIGAQIAHAAQMFILGYLKACESCKLRPHGGKPLLNKNITERWFAGSFRKVILRANEKEFEKIKDLLDVFVVKDAGINEVESGSQTVIVTWPMLKSTVPRELKRLQVLKEPTTQI